MASILIITGEWLSSLSINDINGSPDGSEVIELMDERKADWIVRKWDVPRIGIQVPEPGFLSTFFSTLAVYIPINP